MSALRERLVRAGRNERAPRLMRQRVLRSVGIFGGAGIVAGLAKTGAALALVALGASATVLSHELGGAGAIPAVLGSSHVRVPAPIVPRGLAAKVEETVPSVAPGDDRQGALAIAPTKSRTTAVNMAGAQSSTSLAAEVKALDEARTALANGDADRASQMLLRYRRTFSRPLLHEEATVLEIEALARNGDRVQARTRLATFRKTHPTSPAVGRLARIVGESAP
jgi:hypothetical protein